MADIGLTIKREAAAQGYKSLIRSISGSDPNVARYSDGVNITMTNAQAKEFENFLGSKIPFNLFYLKSKAEQKKAEDEGEGLNVNVNWSKVFIPLAIKTAIPPLILYTLLIIFLSKKRFT